MFFAISKVFYFVCQPLNWVVASLLSGLLRRNSRAGKRLLVIGMVMLVLFTNPLVLNVALRVWERELVVVSVSEDPYDLGIVLGGYSRVIESHADRVHLSLHPNRLVNALELYQAGKIRKVLLVGGSPRFVGKKLTDVDRVRAFLIDSGVRKEDVLVESAARSTHENASLGAELIRRDYPEARCLLITSAVHMRRAEACFRKEGIEVDIFPTDPRAQPFRLLDPYQTIIPTAMGFTEWESLAKEWAGFVVYRMRGYL